MAILPTSSLWTVRLEIWGTEAWTQDKILKLYAKPLTSAGYKLYQSPSVAHYTPKLTSKKFSANQILNDPSSPQFLPEGKTPDDIAYRDSIMPSQIPWDFIPVYEYVFFENADGQRDFIYWQFDNWTEKDPTTGEKMQHPKDTPAYHPMAVKKKVVVTTLTWNIGGLEKSYANDAAKNQAKAALNKVFKAVNDNFRGVAQTHGDIKVNGVTVNKSNVLDNIKAGLLSMDESGPQSTIIKLWQDAPEHFGHYPDRPPIPAALMPVKPVIPPPPPPPVPPPVPIHHKKKRKPPPPPPVEHSWFSPWMLLIPVGGLWLANRKR